MKWRINKAHKHTTLALIHARRMAEVSPARVAQALHKASELLNLARIELEEAINEVQK